MNITIINVLIPYLMFNDFSGDQDIIWFWQTIREWLWGDENMQPSKSHLSILWKSINAILMAILFSIFPNALTSWVNKIPFTWDFNYGKISCRNLSRCECFLIGSVQKIVSIIYSDIRIKYWLIMNLGIRIIN